MKTGSGQDRLRISVVLPHLNQPDALALCLASLRDGQRPPDEIIVVDNGSDALPVETVAGFDNARLLEEETPGPGPARNTGVAASSGDILAFIDSDCIAGPGWLAEIERIFTNDPSAQVLGGDVRINLRVPGKFTQLEAYESIYAYRMDRYIAEQGFTGTGNLAMRRAIFEDVGTFAGLGVAEDRDWGHRATAKGYEIRYCPSMKVFHPARDHFAELAQKWDRHSAHDYAAAQSRAGGRLKFIAKTLAMPLSPLAEIRQILTTDRVTGVSARWQALAGLVRIRLYRARIMMYLLISNDPGSLSDRWNRP
jgi:glycosyltransferase involved in cell wall biosynthesis